MITLRPICFKESGNGRALPLPLCELKKVEYFLRNMHLFPKYPLTVAKVVHTHLMYDIDQILNFIVPRARSRMTLPSLYL